ncbi:molybdenum ABC transporter substrate-binding protein [Bosea sp. AAP35]|uniref:molybdate ABC transporter substrate-binding protein n=1 Tax=Bosea sp. AAP35 TaxID=1523417 RepID=UPI0006B991D5|nr:molybdate ABC transporter substrate-binding protein [Bosea sp. AAP35]KPF72049.1 molybdenum ABC transporter substrate-binding protein [Bosea sp. AAP35]
MRAFHVLLRIAVCAALMACGANAPATAQANAPRIAAASDLKFALDEVIAAFAKDTGRGVVPTYGSSGNFKTQIIQGAPFQIFMSADESFVFELAEKGLTLDRGELYAIGRIVLFAPAGARWTPDAELSDLKAAVSDGRVNQFAIANPDHAPYGRAAEETLRAVGLWDGLRSRLVLGENVSQAAQFATSGSTQGGIFALSLALAPQIEKLGSYALIPADLHKPLRQRMVRMKNADADARAFYDYVQSPPARSVLKRYGFLLPGE